jgi:hypothetical protein
VNETPPVYEIKVQGHLTPRRLQWFDGLTVTQQPNGETVLVGPVQDQSALYGLLGQLQNIGVPLLSIRRLEEAGLAAKCNDRSTS